MSKRKYLLPETGNFFKANLHCHSNLSDGKKSPQELKELYIKKGYSIVAYTDHDIFIPHNDLTDENFLALNGFEVEIINKYGTTPLRDVGRCDICMIALEPDNFIQPCWHRTQYVWGNALNYRDMVQFDENERNYYRSYTPEGVSDMMEKCREKGFFVTHNHPTWSRENYTYYSKYHGMHALEMFNGGCIRGGYEEYNPRVYDDILRTGKKIFCVGGDDNHNGYPDDSRYSDSGWAFTVIKAEKLEYRTITKAMEAGNFYASEGPEIHELYVEDGMVHVKCSPADRIFCTYETRAAGYVLAENDVFLTEASFDVNPELGYFRITVVDEKGKHACTNAYFPEDII
jgi:hypothetical protein